MFEKIKCFPMPRSIANRKEILNQHPSLKEKKKKKRKGNIKQCLNKKEL
jgi:hypothetical protein